MTDTTLWQAIPGAGWYTRPASWVVKYTWSSFLTKLVTIISVGSWAMLAWTLWLGWAGIVFTIQFTFGFLALFEWGGRAIADMIPSNSSRID